MTSGEQRHFLKSIGWMAADLRQARNLAALCERLGEDRIIPVLARESVEAGDKAQRKAVRSLLAALTPSSE